MLPYYTNLEGRKICVENHIHIGDQESEDNIPPQELQEEVELEEQQEENQEEEIQEDEVPTRRSSRQTRSSSRLKDFVTYLVQYSIQNYISYDNITNDHYVFLNALTKIEEPKVLR
jgi:negative regulator of genetic competence, sporulation and motility